MCCMLTVLVFFGPRLAILVWWLIQPLRFDQALDDRWLLTILLWLFLPWTLLMYLFVFPGGLVGFDWVILILGLLADIASYSGGFWGNRNQVPGYAD
ncbi:MAG: hypothetical protein JSV69_02520 [Chloroflexota bacterium]|nr:MAG: hypothetical protein JSV69_02520 [Chloroflexota bacterium]